MSKISQRAGRKLQWAAAVYVVCTTSAVSADWQWNPRLELGGDYNDNFNLSHVGADKLALGGALLDAKVELAVIDPRMQFKLSPEVEENYYPGHSDANSDNEQVGLSFNEQGLTYNAGVYGNWSSRLLVFTGLPSTAIVGDLGQAQQGAAINSSSGFRQDLLNLNPYLNWFLTPRTRLLVQVGYVDSSFNSQQNASYVNSQNIQGSAGIGYDATQTGSISVSGLASRFDPSTGFPSNTYGMQAQWDGHPQQTQQYYVRLGADRTSISSANTNAASRSVTGVLAGAGVHWTLQVSEIFLDATHSVAPSGGGYAVNQTDVRLAANRRLTEKLAVFGALRGIRYSPIDATLEVAPAQTYAAARTGFEWRVTREFSLIGAYNFTTFKNQGAPGADANQISVSFVYELHRPPNGPAITIGY